MSCSIGHRRPNPLRDFLDTYVKPSIDDWKQEPLSVHRAKSVAHHLDSLAEHALEYWKNIGNSQVVYGETEASPYREQLSIRECPDFGLVRDVTDGHKHAHLGRPSKRVTTAEQTNIKATAFGELLWGEFNWGGGDQVVIELDDGSKRSFQAVVANVVQMWEILLQRWGL